MAAINLAGAAIQMAFQKNLSDGITAMFTFFKHTDPMPAGHDTLPSLVQYSTFRSVADIQPGDYFFVPPIANGPNPSYPWLVNSAAKSLITFPHKFRHSSMHVSALAIFASTEDLSGYVFQMTRRDSSHVSSVRRGRQMVHIQRRTPCRCWCCSFHQEKHQPDADHRWCTILSHRHECSNDWAVGIHISQIDLCILPRASSIHCSQRYKAENQANSNAWDHT